MHLAISLADRCPGLKLADSCRQHATELDNKSLQLVQTLDCDSEVNWHFLYMRRAG